ncbi:MAG TPA: hypothetical protein VMP00_03090 [Burkholderiales bacterium]|nr:hypothetical protein [Burkholderiales bacterium]
MKNKKLALGAVAFGCYVCLPAMAQQDGDWSWSLGFDYSEGDYGSRETTEILYVPFTRTLRHRALDLSIHAALREHYRPGNVVPDIGPVGGPSADPRRTTESGIGDLIASATHNLLPGGGEAPIIDLTGKVKLPTASRSKGLGTGEPDFAAQVDVYKPMAPKVTGLGTFGYTILGDPPGVDLRNVFYASLGAVYQIDSQTSAGGTLDIRQRTSRFGDPQRELVGFISYRADANWRVQGYAVRGLADGSPDWGIGAVVVRQY